MKIFSILYWLQVKYNYWEKSKFITICLLLESLGIIKARFYSQKSLHFVHNEDRIIFQLFTVKYKQL